MTLIESTCFKGNGGLILTGNMGEIMRESISTAISWIKSNSSLLNLNLKDLDFTKMDMHVHVPDAAVPKDGPSAGITITCSLVNFFLILGFAFIGVEFKKRYSNDWRNYLEGLCFTYRWN